MTKIYIGCCLILILCHTKDDKRLISIEFRTVTEDVYLKIVKHMFKRKMYRMIHREIARILIG